MNVKPLTWKDFLCRGPWSQIDAHPRTLPSGISSSYYLLDPVCTYCRKMSPDDNARGLQIEIDKRRLKRYYIFQF